MSVNFEDAFTKTVVFPKILFAIEYMVDFDKAFIFHSQFEVFDTFEELQISANNSAANLLGDKEIPPLKSAMAIPLVFENTYPQKKSHWRPDTKPSRNRFMTRQRMIFGMIPHFEHYRALVTCRAYDEHEPLFCCAGYYKHDNQHEKIRVLTKSMAPADTRVSEYASYEIFTPQEISLHPERIRALN